MQVKGSDTEVNLVQRLAEEYMKKDPNASIAVTGGGSGVGIAAIINKTTDLCNASRPMKDSEIAKAKANGVNPVGVAFAVDGLSVIVNAKNSVKHLTTDQIGQIYRGEVSNWKQLGGPGQPDHPVRTSAEFRNLCLLSGTRRQKRLFQQDEPDERQRPDPGSGQKRRRGDRLRGDRLRGG